MKKIFLLSMFAIYSMIPQKTLASESTGLVNCVSSIYVDKTVPKALVIDKLNALINKIPLVPSEVIIDGSQTTMNAAGKNVKTKLSIYFLSFQSMFGVTQQQATSLKSQLKTELDLISSSLKEKTINPSGIADPSVVNCSFSPEI